MKVLMFYEVAPDGLQKAQEHFAGHRARLDEFHARGVLLMAGPYGAPPVGALGVFTSRDAAEEFIKGDPFVLNGVVARHTLHDWNEVLLNSGK
jgi:uncharacterized protein YciI